MRWAATYWGVPGPGTDVTNTEGMAAAAEVCKFKAGSSPGPILVPEDFRGVMLQEGLEPYLHHVKIANHRRALACLKLSCSELRVCTDRIIKPVRPPREQRVCRLCSTGAVEDELHILTTCPAMSGLRASCPELSESTETWPVCLQVASCAHWAGSHARPCESTAAYWRPWASHCGLPTMYHRLTAGLVPAGGDAHSTTIPAGEPRLCI